MKTLILSFAFLTTQAWSQEFFKDVEAINKKIAVDEFKKNQEKPEKNGMSGSFVDSLLMKKKNYDLNAFCEEDKPAEDEEDRYELILMAEGNSQQTSAGFSRVENHYSENTIKNMNRNHPVSQDVIAFSPEAVLNHAQVLGGNSSTFDIHSPVGQELYVETLVQAAARSSLNENELSSKLAGLIGSVYTTDNEKLDVLSYLSGRLADSYNNARNPGRNIGGFDIPEGDMTLNQLMTSAAVFHDLSGGVCNDIAEAVAMVGQKLLPGKDVLTVNSGSHFGVLVSDGKNHNIINYTKRIDLVNKISLVPSSSPTNMRISRVHDGRLQEIAVVDTEMGQFTESAFQTGKTLLKTDADVSSLIATLKKKHWDITAGTGVLSDSYAIIVLAKYQKSSEKWKKHVGMGFSQRNFNDKELEGKFQVHFRAGIERRMIKYASEKAEIKLTTGARINVGYTLNQEKGGLVDFSGGLDVTNRVDMRFNQNNPDGVHVNSTVELENSFGISNQGAMTGALSTPGKTDYGQMFRSMSLHFNQLNASVTADKKIKENMTGFGKMTYQGSNIGQAATILAGLDIKAPAGAQIIVMTGYTAADMGGFKTQHNLTAAQTGFQAQAKYVSKKKVEIGAGVRGLAGGKPTVSGTVIVPLGLGKKR